ncbi:hypothetical protein [Ottowia sp.]|uniref:hypothetical protein n=1 Tax=Ottowia sp. TaxID=1898956 RepID=UPI002C0EF652|nr:hypothetical protein [Ottowia sp.]HOB65821.1 hypothetical protein [Ottowia sp.]HPZ57130.1 hypothetical protein [Ottowia sp.]HQD46815.1 hypothetical protein [Ottowia sp.]
MRRLQPATRRACDHWGDSESARQAMRDRLAEVQPEHHGALLTHFERTYPAQEIDPWAR